MLPGHYSSTYEFVREINEEHDVLNRFMNRPLYLFVFHTVKANLTKLRGQWTRGKFVEYAECDSLRQLHAAEIPSDDIRLRDVVELPPQVSPCIRAEHVNATVRLAATSSPCRV